MHCGAPDIDVRGLMAWELGCSAADTDVRGLMAWGVGCSEVSLVVVATLVPGLPVSAAFGPSPPDCTWLRLRGGVERGYWEGRWEGTGRPYPLGTASCSGRVKLVAGSSPLSGVKGEGGRGFPLSSMTLPHSVASSSIPSMLPLLLWLSSWLPTISYCTRGWLDSDLVGEQ